MKIVIDIPEDSYRKALDGNFNVTAFNDAVRKSTLLPKGHRIGDLDALIRAMKERNEDNGGEPLNAVDRGYDLAYQHMVEETKECVIIEA